MNPKLFMLISICLAAVAQIILKFGLNQISWGKSVGVEMIKAMFLNPTIWFGLLIYGGSSILWMITLTKVQLSFAYPMLAGSYVVVAVLSFFLFHEDISMIKLLGLAIISIGVIVLARG